MDFLRKIDVLRSRGNGGRKMTNFRPTSIATPKLLTKNWRFEEPRLWWAENDWILAPRNYEAKNDPFGRTSSITNTHGFSRNDVLRIRDNGGATQIAGPYCCGVGAAMPVPPLWFRFPPFFCTAWCWGVHPLPAVVSLCVLPLFFSQLVP